MRFSAIRRLAGATLAVCVLASGSFQSAEAQGKPAPPPPYLMKNMDATFVMVVWDAEMIDALLPDGLKPLEGYTGGINLYSVPKGYGLAPYTAAYFYVDVENHVSASGIPGRYVLDGVFGPAAAAEAMNKNYGWHMREGLAIQLMEEGVLTAMAQREGEPLFTVKLSGIVTDCPDFAGSIKYVSPGEDGGMILVETPFSVLFCSAEAVDSIEISAGEDDPLSRYTIKKVVGAAQIRDASFAYGRPEKR